MYIRRNGFPHTVRGGWMSSLINAGEGIDVDVFLRRENRGKTLDKVAQRIRLNRTKLRGMQDTSTDYEELTGSIQSGYYIKSGIANNKMCIRDSDGIVRKKASLPEQRKILGFDIMPFVNGAHNVAHNCQMCIRDSRNTSAGIFPAG